MSSWLDLDDGPSPEHSSKKVQVTREKGKGKGGEEYDVVGRSKRPELHFAAGSQRRECQELKKRGHSSSRSARPSNAPTTVTSTGSTDPPTQSASLQATAESRSTFEDPETMAAFVSMRGIYVRPLSSDGPEAGEEQECAEEKVLESLDALGFGSPPESSTQAEGGQSSSLKSSSAGHQGIWRTKPYAGTKSEQDDARQRAKRLFSRNF